MRKLAIILVASFVMQTMTPISAVGMCEKPLVDNTAIGEEYTKTLETKSKTETLEPEEMKTEEASENPETESKTETSEPEGTKTEEASDNPRTESKTEASEPEGTKEEEASENPDTESKIETSEPEGTKEEESSENPDTEMSETTATLTEEESTENRTEENETEVLLIHEDAVSADGLIQEKYYISADDTYSLFIGAAMPTDLKSPALEEVIYQLDDGEEKKVSVSSGMYYYNSYSGSLTISLARETVKADGGEHTLTVYFTFGGTSYQITGITEFVDDWSREGCIVNESDWKTQYFSSKLGSTIMLIYTPRIKSYEEDEIVEFKLVSRNDGTNIVPESIGQSSRQEYDQRYSTSYIIKGKEYYLSSSILPRGEYHLDSWCSVITLNDNVTEGNYDMVITTKKGNEYRLENAYYATSNPVIFGVQIVDEDIYKKAGGANNGEEDDYWTQFDANNVFFSDNTGNYVAAFVYGLNLNEGAVPKFYDTDNATVLAEYDSTDSFCGYEYGSKWGNFYRLKKKGKATEIEPDGYVNSHIIVTGDDVIYANGKNYCENVLSSKGVFFEEYLSNGQLYDGSTGRIRVYLGINTDFKEGDLITYSMECYNSSMTQKYTCTDTTSIQSNKSGKYIEFDEDSQIYKNWEYKFIGGTTISGNGVSIKSSYFDYVNIKLIESIVVPAGYSYEVHPVGEVAAKIYSDINAGDAASLKSMFTKSQLAELARYGTVRVCIYKPDGTLWYRQLVYFDSAGEDTELEDITIDKAEIASDITISKDKSGVQVVDGKTGKPIAGARVWINGDNYTKENGVAELNQTGLTTIQVEKQGYYTKTVEKKLVKGQCSVIILCPDTGEIEILDASINLFDGDKDVLKDIQDNTEYLIHKDIELVNGIDMKFGITVESAGDPSWYQLIQNGKVVQENDTGKFEFSGKYTNDKQGDMTYYTKDLSAGYKVYVRVYDKNNHFKTRALNIKVSEESSLRLGIKENDNNGKIDMGDGLKLSIPDEIPILGGSDLNFGFEERLPFAITVDKEGLVKIAINMGDFDTSDSAKWYEKKQEFKNLSSRAETLWKSSTMFGEKPESFGAGLFAIDGSIVGYGEGYLDDKSDRVCVDVGVILKVKAEKKFTKYSLVTFVVVPIPVFVTFKGGVSCTATGEVNFSFGDKGFQINGGNLEIEPSLYVSPEIGAGVDEVVCLKGMGNLEFSWLHRFSNHYNRVSLDGNAKIKGTFLCWDKEWTLAEGEWVIYDSNQKNAYEIGNYSADSYYDMSGAKIISMDYLSKREQRGDNAIYLLESTNASGKNINVQKYAYENASPRLIQAGNKWYLFYLDGVIDRKAQNQTALFYRSSSDEGATWSEAVRVDNGANETADYNFDVATDGNNIYAVWSDAGAVYGDEILSEDTEEALAKVAKEMNLMTARIDGVTGEIEIQTIATDDADLQPQISLGDGETVYISWITNDVSSENGFFSNENQMGLCYTSSADNYEVHKTILPKGHYPISLDTGMLGSKSYLAASVDIDGDLDTQNDRDLFLLNVQDGTALSKLTSNDKTDSVPLFGSVEGKNCLFWYQDGNIAYTSNGENIQMVFSSENIPSMGQDFTLLEGKNGNVSIVWSSMSLTEDANIEVYCTDFSGNEWSQLYKLCELESQYTSSLSGFLKGSDYYMCYLNSIYEDDGVYSHICMLKPEKTTDVSVACYAPDNEIEGAEYPLNFTVHNNGNTMVDSLSIKSKDGSIQDTITGLAIAPGTSKEFVWSGITLPENMTEICTYSLTVAADGEIDTTDNIFTLCLGAPDFSVEACLDSSSGENFASVNITNSGILSSDVMLTIYRDENHTKKLYQTNLLEIEGGNSRVAVFDLTVLDNTSPVFYFAVSDKSGKELYMNDNETVLYIGKGGYLEYIDNPPIETYTVAFDSNGGSEVEPQTVQKDTKALEPSMPTKEGYRFIGWYLDGSLFDFDTIIISNITLKAMWAEFDKTAVPTSSIASGSEVVKGTELSLVSEEGAFIYYTIDGTAPTRNSILYRSPIIINIDVTIKAIAIKEGFKDSDTATFIYTVKVSDDPDISEEYHDGLWISGVDQIGYIYTGEAVKPAIKVYDKITLLTEKIDYTIAYKNNTKVGKATITVTGKGNYSGKETETFDILPVDIGSEEIHVMDYYVKIGSKAQKPVPELYYMGTKLKNNKDFTILYSNTSNVYAQTGEYSVTVTGKGNYTGTRTLTLIAVEKIVKPKPVSIAKATLIGFDKTFTYTGRACKQECKLIVKTSAGEKILDEGMDYSIQYANNIKAGTATVTYYGRNGYTGKLKKTYKILPYNILNDAKAKIKYENYFECIYAKGGSKPKPVVTFDGKVMKEGVDYTLSYKYNKAVFGNQTPCVTVNGKGCFKGKIPINFTIKAQDLSQMVLVSGDKIYKNKANIYKITPKLMDLDGKLLSAGKDFDKKSITYVYENDVVLENGVSKKAGSEVEKTDIIPADTQIRITLNCGNGSNYTGTFTGTYRITKADIKSAKVIIPKQVYTGNEITLDKSQITVKLSGVTLKPDDYEIIRYADNVKKGNASVTIKGKGNYGGVKTVKFTIGAKGFLWWWR